MRGVRGVSFDAGGTLIEPWPSVGQIYAEVAAESGLPDLDPAQLNRQFCAAWRAKIGFNYSQEAWADLVVRTFERPAAEVGVDTALFTRLYRRFTEARSWTVYEDVLPVLTALRREGLSLAVTSNWDDRLRPLFRNLGLDGFFAAIEVSRECGHHKPSPEIFWRSVRALGVPPETVLHVGDSRHEDFEGARAAGLRSLWLRRGHASVGAEEVTSLLDLVTR